MEPVYAGIKFWRIAWKLRRKNSNGARICKNQMWEDHLKAPGEYSWNPSQNEH